MPSSSQPVDPRCKRFCKRNCTEFNFVDAKFQEEVLSDCNWAHSSCDCRPFWKVPVFWIVSISFGLAFLQMINMFVIRPLIDRYRRKNNRTFIAGPVSGVSIVGQSLPVAGDANMNPFVAAEPVPQVHFRKSTDIPPSSFTNRGF